MGLMPTKQEATQPESTRDPSRYIEEGESNVTPEEQAEYEAFIDNALKLIYAEGEVRPEVLESLKAPPAPEGIEGQAPAPPVLALANTAVQIAMRLDDSARESQAPISDDVLMHGGVAVIEELAEIAGTAKIHDYTEEELSGALTVAVDMYREKAIQDGRTTKETLEGQFGEAVKADQEGRLGDVVPGVEQPE